MAERPRGDWDCIGAAQDAYAASQKERRERTKPQPWIVQKFVVGVVLAIVVWTYYVYVGRMCVTLLRRGETAKGGVYIAIFNLFFLMFGWTYLKALITPPGFARDLVPTSEPPATTQYGRPWDVDSEARGTDDEHPTIATPYEEMSERGHAQPTIASVGTVEAWTVRETDAIPGVAGLHAQVSPGHGRLPGDASTALHGSRPAPQQSTEGPSEPTATKDGKKKQKRPTHISRVPPQTPFLAEEFRYCLRDQLLKPMRTHHCRLCATCVLQYDHHVPPSRVELKLTVGSLGLGQCVGAFNRKVRLSLLLVDNISLINIDTVQFFLNFVFWSMWFTAWIFATLLSQLVIDSNGGIDGIDGQEIGVIALAGLFTAFTAGLAVSHTRLLCLNATTVEALGWARTREKDKANLVLLFGFWECGKRHEQRKRWDEEWGRIEREGNLWWLENARTNWEQVMGHSVWEWFLPIGKSPNDGMHYPVNPRHDSDGRWRPRSQFCWFNLDARARKLYWATTYPVMVQTMSGQLMFIWLPSNHMTGRVAGSGGQSSRLNVTDTAIASGHRHKATGSRAFVFQLKMAMFAGTYPEDRSPYASKRNTLEARKMTLPEPEHHLLSPTPIIDDDIAAAELRIARLNKIHNCESWPWLDFMNTFERGFGTDVLPPAVRDAKQAWTIWSQGIAVTVNHSSRSRCLPKLMFSNQTALFAAVEAQLFSLIDTTNSPTPLHQAFRVFSYLGLLSNLLATTSALFVLERISGLSTRARKLALVPGSLPRQVADGIPLPPELLHPLKETALLRAFGMDATWGYTIGMFYLFAFAGCISIFVQLSLYLFIREPVAVAVVLTALVMFGLTPLVVLALRIIPLYLAGFVRVNMWKLDSTHTNDLRHCQPGLSDSRQLRSSVDAIGSERTRLVIPDGVNDVCEIPLRVQRQSLFPTESDTLRKLALSVFQNLTSSNVRRAHRLSDEVLVQSCWDRSPETPTTLLGFNHILPSNCREREVWSVAYSPDGAHIASGYFDGSIRIWDAQTGQPVGQPLNGHTGAVNSVAYSPDGAYIASGSGDRTVRIWDAHTGQPVGQPFGDHTHDIWSIVYSPDGAYIASGSGDGTVRIWRATTGQPVRRPLKGHTDWAHSVAYSPDGAHIASGSFDGTVRIWDTRTGMLVGESLDGPISLVSSVVYSPDGAYIASGCGDGTVRIWDAQTGQAMGQPLHGHRDQANSVAYSPDGAYITSGSNDRAIRIWDAHTGKPVGQPLNGHADRVNSVVYSPSGAYIASGSSDGTVRIWDAHIGRGVQLPEALSQPNRPGTYPANRSLIPPSLTQYVTRISKKRPPAINSSPMLTRMSTNLLSIFGSLTNSSQIWWYRSPGPSTPTAEILPHHWVLDDHGWVVNARQERVIWTSAMPNLGLNGGVALTQVDFVLD
ncbi:palmitoyltransferase pfa5 [Ceratobasidium sp. 414]|nr:palmitoyltransferase pfa5 [Ceratobasidium sp. 414]